MGIDYGTKRVGVALSDERGEFAFPKTVLSNNDELMSEVVSLGEAYKVDVVVVGESKQLSGEDNPLMSQIKMFCGELEEQGVFQAVALEPEFLTSFQARRVQGQTEMTDASAAAIILQSYIDKNKNQ